MSFGDLEVTVAVGMVILIVQTWPRLQSVRLPTKCAHFMLYALLLWMALGGMKCLIFLCVRPRAFLEHFYHSIGNIGPALMASIAVMFSVGGLFLTACLVYMGSFSRRARDIFLYMAVPYTTLYPLIMCKAAGLDKILSPRLIYFCVMISFAVGIVSVIFYKKALEEQFRAREAGAKLVKERTS